MGASSSHQGVPGQNHSALPADPIPYNGPAIEYRIVAVFSKLKGHSGFGSQVATSDVQSYYGTLAQQYGEYFKLNTFFQVPLGCQQRGFTSVTIPFQGVLSRPAIYAPSNEKWLLQVQQSTIQISRIRGGALFSFGGCLDEHVGDIYNRIVQCAQTGGKLICMECSGNVARQGTFNPAAICGVDLFFDVPQHPNPTIYTYVAYSTPMNVSYGFGSCSIQCDWNGTLAMHLDQGWKLVDIFIPQQEASLGQQQQSYMRNLNTIWFFEKEAAKSADMTPRYQVTMVEYYMRFSAGFGSVNANLDLGPMITEMGGRGWELVCVLDTPQTTSGFGSGTRTVIVFFQRPIAGVLPPVGFVPAPALPPITEPTPPPTKASSYK